jgi:hypothetical protein
VLAVTNPLFEPVSAAKQREALNLIAKDFFGADSFKFKPELIARLGERSTQQF